MNFSYKAIDEQGKVVSGTLEAESVDAANNKLLGQGLIPEKVKKAGSAPKISFLDTIGAVKPQELILFTKQFRTLFRAGISVVELLKTLQEQTENKKFKAIIKNIEDDIRQGLSLYDSFSKYPYIFSNLYCSMVKAGEASGALPEVLDRLAYLLDHEFKVKQDIKSALQYPIIVLIALGIAFFVLLTFVIPKFVGIFKSAGIDLPLPTLICMHLYHFISTYWYLCLGGAALLIGGTIAFCQTARGKLIKDAFFLSLPILGPVFKKAAMSRFASIFAILQASGVSVLNSIDILSGTIGNTAIGKQFTEIKEKLKQGRGISAPLRSAKYFTPMVINMVAIGEESGNLDEMLKEVATHYDEEVAYAVNKMSTNLGPILMVGLAAVVGFFALAIFLPMWDLTKMVK